MQTNQMSQNTDQWLPEDKTWESGSGMRKGSQRSIGMLLETMDIFTILIVLMISWV